MNYENAVAAATKYLEDHPAEDLIVDVEINGECPDDIVDFDKVEIKDGVLFLIRNGYFPWKFSLDQTEIQEHSDGIGFGYSFEGEDFSIYIDSVYPED